MIGRRTFIALLGGAATWPLEAWAQQAAGMPVIGFLHSASPEPYAPMMGAFREALTDGGLLEGRNVVIEYRWAEGQFHRLSTLAAELVARRPAVLVAAGGDISASAAKASTDTIPIVFSIGSDPVAQDLVSSLARPTGNVTGVTFFTITLGPKRLELLRELVPKTARIALLINPSGRSSDVKEVGDAARVLGQQIEIFHAGSAQEIDDAFRSLAQQPADALMIISNPFFTSRRDQIVTLANYQKVPTVYPLREYVAAGELLCYGASIRNAYHQTGAYVARILKGEKPADLPVQQPTKFELVINLRTAKALGLEIPATLLARADEVIE